MAADKPAGEEPAPGALDGGTRVGVQTLRAEAAGPEWGLKSGDPRATLIWACTSLLRPLGRG